MRFFILSILSTLLLTAYADPGWTTRKDPPMVLVLVEGLGWEDVESDPELARFFGESAVATVSTAQGKAPGDPRMGYIFLGAGARTDSNVLPDELPRDRSELRGAFDGPASTVRPGAFGEALARAGVPRAAVGERAALVVMDREGRVPLSFDGASPASGVRKAIKNGAKLIAVDAAGAEEAAGISSEALLAGAKVAVASPNAPPGASALTPFALNGREGVLYSPTTRTSGLISNADVAPILLAELGVRPPNGMQGRAAEVQPGTLQDTQRLSERISFASGKRFGVLATVGALLTPILTLIALKHRRRGLRTGVLALAALPAGSLLSAAIPVTGIAFVAALTVLFTGALAWASRRLTSTAIGALGLISLLTAALLTADAAAGGAVMRYSILGYSPADGFRFYGVGNEYAAILAGALTMGQGMITHQDKLPMVPAAAAGAAAVLVLGLPMMGADVGGSLALGLGLGATVGLLRGSGRRSFILWTGGGFALATALFLASGLLFPDVSHGSRAASGEGGLYEMLIRKLLMSLSLLNPLLLGLLAAGVVLIHAGWRRTRGTPLAAGMLGAGITAAASGVLNDSGIVATLLALIYPATAALAILLATPEDI